MGLRIGQYATAAGPVRYPPPGDWLGFRAPDARDGPGFFPESEKGGDFFAQEARTPELQAGFGENTVSIPGLTVNAIERNLSEARRIVPDLQEQQQRVRDKAAKQRELLAPRESRFEPVAFDQSSYEYAARAQARQFITAVNDAAESALARFGDEEASTDTEGGPAIRIGGQSIELYRQEDATPRFSALA